MVKKFFPLDKNYLLEEAQLALQDDLLITLINSVKAEYEMRNNPLGICDTFIERVRRYTPIDLEPLHNFYQTLAGVYRYKFGDSQLEFNWDGIPHSEKYKSEWSDFFNKQIQVFCKNDLFIKAILDLTVFHNYSQLAENRMNNFMLQTFEVKLRNGHIRVA